jgi:hypothetical protein
MRLIRRMKGLEGIQFKPYQPERGGGRRVGSSPHRGEQLDLEALVVRGSQRLSRKHFMIAQIQYPDAPADEPAFLIYVKPTFTGDESTPLLAYRAEDPAFPHDPTVDQFISERRFESYRELGIHIGDRLWSELFKDEVEADPAGFRLARWSPPVSAAESRGPIDATIREAHELSTEAVAVNTWPAFKKVLLDRKGSLEIRLTAMEALGDLEDSDASLTSKVGACLAQVAGDRDEHRALRAEATWRIGELKTNSPKIRQVHRKIAMDTSEAKQLRLSAVELLAKLRVSTKREIGALRQLAESNDDTDVCNRARWALELIGQ